MNKLKHILLWSMATLASSAALTGCYTGEDVASEPKKIAAYMQTLQLDDMYLVKCSPFFTYETIQKLPYCYLRVTAVTPEKVSFIMADRVMSNVADARNQMDNPGLTTSDSDFSWDVNYTKTIDRSALTKLHTQGQIFMIRRLTPTEVQDFNQYNRKPL